MQERELSEFTDAEREWMRDDTASVSAEVQQTIRRRRVKTRQTVDGKRDGVDETIITFIAAHTLTAAVWRPLIRHVVVPVPVVTLQTSQLSVILSLLWYVYKPTDMLFHRLPSSDVVYLQRLCTSRWQIINSTSHSSVNFPFPMKSEVKSVWGRKVSQSVSQATDYQCQCSLQVCTSTCVIYKTSLPEQATRA